MKKRITLVLMLITCFVLSGCVKVAKLTEAESNLISQYATETLLKHSNKNNSLLLSKDQLAKEEEKEKKKEEEKKEDEKVTPPSSSTEHKEDKPNNTPSQSNTDTSDAKASTLTEALGISGLDASILNHKVVETYSTDYVLIQPTAGNNLLILNIALKNTKDSKLVCDINGLGAGYEILVNGSSSYKNMLTILASDMSTLKTEIEAGTTRNVVLVFNVPKATLSNIESLDLIVSGGANSGNYKVKV